jgi:hypothetical protein
MVIIPFLVAGGIVLLAISVIIYAAISERQRILALGETAAELGFDFTADAPSGCVEDLSDLYLFQHGDQPRVRNLLQGNTAELGVSIFDYSYSTGSGKSRQTITQTVICFRATALRLPAFSLRPESFWHRIGQLFGMKDIEFDTHPQFSKMCLLRGINEDAIRAVFTETVLEFFEDRPGISVEATDGILILYRQGIRTDPEAVREFLAEGFDVLGVLRSHQLPE